MVKRLSGLEKNEDQEKTTSDVVFSPKERETIIFSIRGFIKEYLVRLVNA